MTEEQKPTDPLAAPTGSPPPKALDEMDSLMPCLPVPFPELYAEASKVQDRIYLIQLAKEYHIRKQNFVEATKYRAIEKRLNQQVDEVVLNFGKNALSEDERNK